MIRIFLLTTFLTCTLCWADCVSLFKIVSSDVIESMQKTHSNWSAIDRSMDRVIRHGDKSVPFLALYIKSDAYLGYDEPWGKQKARALYLLSQIGTESAEALIVDAVGNFDKPDDIAVTSLAILNGEDVVEDVLIERAFYQHKYIGDRKAALIWWESEGIKKYEKNSLSNSSSRP